MSVRRFGGPDRHGFVLGLVVLMLFAISVASATGYLVVNNEFQMSRGASEGAEALAVARAGLHRFAAEQMGVVGDSVSYAIGNGIALITSRKIMAKDSLTDMYYLRSEATVTDIRRPDTPARRVVGGYAWHHRRPLAHLATVVVANNRLHYDADLHGVDSSTVADCAGGGATTISAGAALANNFVYHGSLVGALEVWPGGYSAFYDSIGLRWDVLQDPNFPVEFEDSPPDFASLPADSFPVVRYNGNLWAGSSWDGRGVLIVTGKFDMGSLFDWDGIVLAGTIDDNVDGEIRGMLIAGMDGVVAEPELELDNDMYYYSCNVYAANESLSYLELLENTVFEAN